MIFTKVLAIVSGSIVWLTWTPIYEASAWMEIKERPMYVAFEPHGDGNAKLFFQTQIQTIKSPVVLAKVSVDPQIGWIARVT